jgi:hypothetical protein
MEQEDNGDHQECEPSMGCPDLPGKIPKEVCLLILGWLDYKVLGRVEQVCQRFPLPLEEPVSLGSS